MSPSLQVVEMAEAFWAASRAEEVFPRDIRRAVARSQPVAVVLLPELHVSAIETWLRRQGRSVSVGIHDRPLRACLVAQAGAGIIFVDGTDPEDEQRFSIAHEIAHFLLDYQEPRRAAVARYGAQILDVLDGHRPASDEERIAALLTGVKVQRHVHLMGRSETLSRAEEISQAELLADALALELLAPWDLVCWQMQEAGIAQDRRDISRWLAIRFGLPEEHARRYAARLSPSTAPSSALLRYLRHVELSERAGNTR